MEKTPIFAIDFGTQDAMQVYGPNGPISKKDFKFPPIRGGKTARDEFIRLLEALLKMGDVVCESPTIGASGAEVGDVLRVVESAKNTLFTVSARAVKNYRADFGLAWHKGARYAKDGAPPPQIMELKEQVAVHIEDAQIIYVLATETPWRLRKWHIATPANRIFTSVRPSDKRGYRDERSDQFMRNLPPFESLPDDIKAVVGVKGKYSRAMVLPFAMSLEEPFLEDGPPEEARKRHQKILGSYDHGYPSFYRRMTIMWMQTNAKMMAGVTRIGEVPREIRKEAWKVTQRQLRHLFHLATIAA